MVLSRLHDWLTAPLEANDRSKSAKIIWLGLSVIVAASYSFVGLKTGFRSEYAIQDDAREYVFWMQRFIDPELLPHDLIADYFKSITPPGYAALFQVGAAVGIAPLLLSKLLPIGLSLILTVYCFGVTLQLFPIPAAGFVASLLLNQSLWFQDDLASAVPRAVVTPLFLAFLYYRLRASWLGVAVVLGLQGCIYPPIALVSIGVVMLGAWSWQGWKPHLVKSDRHWLLVAGVGVLAMLPYAIAAAKYGPVVTLAQAKTMPEFYPGGRHAVFDENLWRYWLFSRHGGLVPRRLRPPVIWVGGLLPVGLWFRPRLADRLPLILQVKPTIAILAQTVVVSVGWFLVAHAIMLKLFFPSRYTTHTLRIAIALAAGILVISVVDGLFRLRWHRLFSAVATIVILSGILVYPAVARGFPGSNFTVANAPALYQFFQQQPKDSLIATLSKHADEIPTFGRRSILTGREYALPFHLGYYRQLYQRSSDLIRAQYSSDLSQVQQFIANYGIDFWLLDDNALTRKYLANKSWLRSFQPAYSETLQQLQQGTTPILSQLTQPCAVFQTKEFVVLQADCILKAQRR